ncbi:MAG TPA: hypothetical protein VG937_23865 [Polyangiaceae bacterium]|nr:hypothetical protein [Polyangiaceae bacterium]
MAIAVAAGACSATNSPTTNSTGGSTTGGSGQPTGGTTGTGGTSTTTGGTGTGTGGISSGTGGTSSTTGGSGPGTGGSSVTGGMSGTTGGLGGVSSTGGSGTTGGTNGGTSTTGGTNGGTNGGGTSKGGGTTGGSATGGTNGGTSSGGSGGGGGCTNTNTGVINLDASGYVCNNTWGIKGAWYCYTDGSDSGTSCKGSDGKGTGAIPWNAGSSAMCLSGTMGTGTGNYAGIGFKVNSGPPGSTDTPGTWNGSALVGFAITLTPGSTGKGSGGMVLNLEYPTSANLDPQTKDAPGVTLPGVGSAAITYNVLFADAVLANNPNNRFSVDPSKLTDLKLAFFPDSISHTYDFCIKSIVPLTTAPNPVVAAGTYGPTWNNQKPQAVNGVNGYAVQSAPFPTNGNPMTMQVSAPAGGVGFTYTAGSGFQAPNNGPGAFPAVISGWGPGHDGIQFYGPYKGGKTIGQLTSIKSSWTYTMGSSGNAVYDIWFGSSATPPVPGVELMIWIGNKDKNPLGSVAGTALDGRTPYVGTNGTGEKVVSYWVPTGTTGTASNFDVLAYIKDAASKGYGGLSNNSYLLGVQTGFEVYSGTWTTTNYNITIQ